jgi:hypothetical protein
VSAPYISPRSAEENPSWSCLSMGSAWSNFPFSILCILSSITYWREHRKAAQCWETSKGDGETYPKVIIKQAFCQNSSSDGAVRSSSKSRSPQSKAETGRGPLRSHVPRRKRAHLYCGHQREGLSIQGALARGDNERFDNLKLEHPQNTVCPQQA